MFSGAPSTGIVAFIGLVCYGSKYHDTVNKKESFSTMGILTRKVSQEATVGNWQLE